MASRVPPSPGLAVVALLVAAALPAQERPAAAHALESSLERLSQLSGSLDAHYELESRFGSGEPAAAATVRLIPPGGQPIEVGRTDPQGRLRFSLPDQARSDWELQVDGGPGHRDYLELPSGGGQPAARRAQPMPRGLAIASALGAGLIGLCGSGLALRARRSWPWGRRP